MLATGISREISSQRWTTSDRPPEHLGLRQARDRRGGGVPETDHTSPVDEDDAVADRFERPRRPTAPLGLGVEARVVDRGRRMPGELLREGQVALVVRPLRPGGDEADGAEDLPARDQGHGHVRARRQRACDLELALVEPEGCERLVVDLAHEHRLAVADRAGAGRARRRQHRLLQLARERQLEGVDVLERQTLELAVDEDVDRAPVRNPWHGEPGDVRERLLVVERAAEHTPRLDEEMLAVLGEPAIVDVDRRAHPADHPADVVPGGQRAREMPAVGLVGGAAQPVLALPGLAPRHRFRPTLEQLTDVLGVDDRLPVGLRIPRQAGVVEPSLVVIGDPSVRVGREHDLRHRVGKGPIPLLAFPLEHRDLLGFEQCVLTPDLDRFLPEVDEHGHLRPQDVRVEGLHQIVDGSGSVALEDVLGVLRDRGQEDDRNVPRPLALLDQLGGLEAVHARHLHVEQDRGEFIVQQVAQRLFARLDTDELLAQRLEDRLEREEVLRPIVDQEQLRLLAHGQHSP